MSAPTEAQRDAEALARSTRVELIAAALPGSVALEFAPMLNDRIELVRNVLDAADAVDQAIEAGTLNPHPSGVICPDCGKWSDRPANTCRSADDTESRRRTACAQRTEQQIRAIVRDETRLGHTPSPATTNPVIEAMHAIRALHPAANVSVELRDGEGYAAVTVIGLPDDTFGGDRDSNDYPICWHTRGGYINVCRYHDSDIEAALATALEIITTRGGAK